MMILVLPTDRHRSLSFTEVSTALTCWAQWDFQYGGRLAGATLKPRHIMPRLTGGSAWGAAVAAYHAHGQTFLAEFEAMSAMRASLDKDVARMVKDGAMIEGVLLGQRMELEEHLGKVFAHYRALARPFLNLTRLEDEIWVPIPSRGGKRASTRYRFQCFLDGFEVDDHDHEWLVEFKYRTGLTSRRIIELGRQYRWYSWARQKESGRQVVGIKIEERLAEFPKPPKIVRAKRKGEGVNGFTVSHDSAQITTPELYLAACKLYDVEPHDDVVHALGSRVWQQRIEIPFRPSELREAGAELTSAAKLIRDLDSGELYPIRNASPRNCGGCRFKDVCAEPRDELFVDQMFIRSIPKRLRPPLPQSGRDGTGVVPAQTSEAIPF